MTRLGKQGNRKNNRQQQQQQEQQDYLPRLKPTTQKVSNKTLFGFDIETYDKNKKFLMASLYNSDIGYIKCFYSKTDFIEELTTNPIFKDSLIVATNLSFDFFGMFFNSRQIRNFNTLFSGSSLLKASVYLFDGMFFPYPRIKRKKLPSITFIDTCNYIKMSVDDMGKVLDYPKLHKPDCLGHHPKNEDEWEEMIRYNIRDSEITYRFMTFLVESFKELGASFKNTIASTSMSLFTNKYLDNEYYVQDKQLLLEQFQSYYGGRTESFRRGKLTNMKYYDFNSLYPSCMVDIQVPDPNHGRVSYSDTLFYIKNYTGCSYVDVTCPDDMQYPILPYRDDKMKKVLFPTGRFCGWYTHMELYYAIQHGYQVNKVYKTQYYTKTCTPFNRYITDLYNLRKKYKSKGSPMELVAKLMMNSLYGKFCQKFTDTDNWLHESLVTEKHIKNSKTIERVDEFIRLVRDTEPTNFCLPIWGSYISAKGRLKMHEVIKNCDTPVYCDTDSIISKDEFDDSTELGGLKLEMDIDVGYVVKPKFYALRKKKSDNDQYDDFVKVKGLGKRLCYYAFTELVTGQVPDNKIVYDKFTKFKEAIKRGFIPNEIIETHKSFSLEDNKRDWQGQLFDPETLQNSRPVNIIRPGN